MEVIRSCETAVTTYMVTQCHNLEDHSQYQFQRLYSVEGIIVERIRE
jgi:hypothetical protein